MADQPPPFGGHPQQPPPSQWPPHPVMIPPAFPPNFQLPPGSQLSPAYPLDHNWASFYANSQIAGAGNNGATFYPPPFPYMNHSGPQGPPQFAPPQLPPGYASIPVPNGPPAGSVNASFSSTTSGYTPKEVEGQLVPVHSSKVTDPPSEEGEVSEPDVGHSQRSRTQKPSRKESELVEGETGFPRSASQSSSRSSSPYIPPLSVPADSDLLSRAIEQQKGGAATPNSDFDMPSLKSATQLRVQAQGALLSLVPHNIQYHELVAEGLDPKILKQLYDDVGIKIATPRPEKSTGSISNHLSAQSPPTAGKQSNMEPAPIINTQPPSSASQAAAQKPLERKEERKELIARMLAEKAAKKSQPSTAQSSPKDSSKLSPSAPIQKPSTAVPARPKNKAQTDLARQRIEELKRQALLKSQQKSKTPSHPPGEPNGDSSENLGDPAPIQHPLPARPPIPQLPVATAIPGLSMTDSRPDLDAKALPADQQGIIVDSTPVARASQRKRPRASDFDEPETTSKRHSDHGQFGPADRLVIDISEDEEDDDDSIYGENDDAMDVDSSPGDESESAPVTNRPSPQKYPSSTRASTSTPQGSTRPGDHDHIRQRDLEIQAMRRKIAELEQKRKAKLAASQTDSSQAAEGTPDGSSASSGSAVQLSPADADETEYSKPVSTSHDKADSAPVANEQETARQDESQQERRTDEALASSQASLQAQPLESTAGHQNSLVNMHTSQTGDDSVRLSSVTSSDSESTGSSMNESDVGEIRSEESISDEADSSTGSSEDSAGPETIEEIAPAMLPTGALAETVTNQTIDDQERPLPNGQPGSERSNTSQDEVKSVTSNSQITQPDLGAVDHSLPEHLPIPAAREDMMDVASPQDPNTQYLDESCEESETYEPPEPGRSEDADGSAYSPPFSPAPPAPVESPTRHHHEDVTTTQVAPSTDEVLTHAHQPSVSEPQPNNQVILGNEAPSNHVDSGFTPYVSPLRYFKAYRYHPNFAEDVPNGYRSLTYSNNVDPWKYLCPYEAMGGVCNDRSCENQHFRDMTLSDDKILIQMGSVREGDTEEEREAYIAGLKEIINEMRREKVKDFGSVAAEIAAYRRRFLKDPSRVLPL